MDPVKKTFVSKEFIAFTACSMILTALGIDIMLPAFANVRQYFSSGNNSTETAQLVSCFFMGQVTQVLFDHPCINGKRALQVVLLCGGPLFPGYGLP